MYKIKAGLITIEGEKFGCILEVRNGVQNFAHLVNGDCYNEDEVDRLEILENELNIDIETLCERIESKHYDSRNMKNLVSGMMLIEKTYGDLYYLVTTPEGWMTIDPSGYCESFNQENFKKAYIPKNYGDPWVVLEGTEIIFE
jgi:hypothetical protein